MAEVEAMEKLKHERIVQYIRHEVIPDERDPGMSCLFSISLPKVDVFEQKIPATIELQNCAHFMFYQCKLFLDICFLHVNYWSHFL